jgi:D-3-phosphoglycerate dehydrogenase / 2-oxoglutarate reductase
VTGPVVLVTPRSFSSGDLDLLARLRGAGADVVLGAADHDVASLRPLLAGAVAWIAGAAPVTAEHLDAAPRLRLVARYGVGVDAVDLAAAAERGVMVSNTPGANSDAVAEHALALLLTCVRHVVTGDRGVRAGDWSVARAKELKDLRVGIVGFGRIGRALATRLLPFGTSVLASDPFLPAADLEGAGVRAAGLADLPARCDVVSLHAPGEHAVVDARWLAASPGGLVLVNTARASLVDETAVADALRDGRLAAYAADDLAAGHGATSGPLLADDLAGRVVLTPHSAAQTVEAVDNMGTGATDAVLALLSGSTPEHLVTGSRS